LETKGKTKVFIQKQQKKNTKRPDRKGYALKLGLETTLTRKKSQKEKSKWKDQGYR